MGISGTVSLDIPGNSVTNDTVFVVLIADQSIAAPSGWTKLTSGAFSGLDFWIGERTVTVTDPGALYTWTLANPTATWAGALIDVRSAAGFDGLPSFGDAANVTSVAAPSVTLSAANELVLAVYAILSPDDISLPNLTSVMGHKVISRGNISMALEAFQPTVSGATGDQTATWANSTPSAVGSQTAFVGSATLVNMSLATSD